MLQNVKVAKDPTLRVQKLFAELSMTDAIANMDLAKGEKGDDGYTPVVGKDYFTPEQANAWIEFIQSRVHDGKDGKDGATGAQGPRGVAGKDGKDGISPDTDEVVARVLTKITFPDFYGMVNTAVGSIKKEQPTQKDIINGILSDPRLRLLMHGGGSGGATTNFVDDETVAGSGTAWTLASTPTAGSLKLFALGQRLVLTTDYSIVANNITTVNSWGAGELLADYRTA